jgi:hypothetical protein
VFLVGSFSPGKKKMPKEVVSLASNFERYPYLCTSMCVYMMLVPKEEEERQHDTMNTRRHLWLYLAINSTC